MISANFTNITKDNDNMPPDSDIYFISIFLIIFLLIGVYVNYNKYKGNREKNNEKISYINRNPKIITKSINNSHKTQNINNQISFIDDKCVICLYNVKNCRKSNISVLKCKHVYHRECIDKWKKQYNNLTCPLCRDNIV